MNNDKADRLKHLPPAARVALVGIHNADCALSVKLRYVVKPRGTTTLFVYPGSELMGVHYDVWRNHVGRWVRLWEWHGTDEGMIGGPAKRQADFTFFGGVWEWPETYSHDELRWHADRLEQWLADERYEFSARCRAKVESKIISLRQSGRGLTHVEEWLEEMESKS